MPQRAGPRTKSPAFRVRPALFLAASFIAMGAAPMEGGSEERRFVCPLDGSTFKSTRPISWNLAGGRDSDGCVYSLEEGGLVPHATGALLTCPRCLYTAEPADFALALSATEKRRLQSALTEVSRSIPRSQQRWRIEPVDQARLAAAGYQSIGWARLKKSEREAATFVLGLWLRAAWLERGRAIGKGGASAFRPQNLKAGLAAFERLEAELRQRRRPGRDELELIEQVRAEVEALRSPTAEAEDAEAGFRRFQLEARLLRIEGGLERLRELARTRIDRAAAALVETEERSLKVRLVQAAIRLGLAERRDALLAELRSGSLPPTLQSALASLIEHVEAEQEAMARALAQLRKVKAPGLELQVLEADLARRLGKIDEARAVVKRLTPLSGDARAELALDFAALRGLLERPR